MKKLSAAEFLQLVWPSPLLTNETLELRAIDRNTQQVHCEFATSISDFLKRAYKYRDLEVYFGVSTRYGNGGKKKDCYRVRTVWADLDDRRITECNLDPRPDILVDSGGGSHAYWTLSSPVLVKDERWKEIEAVNRGLVEEFDGDIAAIDVSRILRVPGYLNRKRETPRVVRAYLL